MKDQPRMLTLLTIYLLLIRTALLVHGSRDKKDCDHELINGDSELMIVNGDMDLIEVVYGLQPWHIRTLLLSVDSPAALTAMDGQHPVSMLIRFQEPRWVTTVSIHGHLGAFYIMYKLSLSADGGTLSVGDGDGGRWRYVLTSDGLPYSVRSTQDGKIPWRLPNPLLADAIRLIPVSMAGSNAQFRMQLYGCPVREDNDQSIYFGGSKRVENEHDQTVDLSHSAGDRHGIVLGPVNSERWTGAGLKAQLRFRTAASNGMLFNSLSSQNHWLIIQMRRGALDVLFNLGWGGRLELETSGGHDDNEWHDLYFNVDYDQRVAVLIVDNVRFGWTRTPRQQIGKHLDILNKVGSAIGKYPILDFAVEEPFHGCVATLRLNDVNLLELTARTALSGRDPNGHQFDGTTTIRKCQTNPPGGSITKAKTSFCLSSLPGGMVVGKDGGCWLKREMGNADQLRFSFQFATFERNAELVEVPLLSGKDYGLKLKIHNGRLALNLTTSSAGPSSPILTELSSTGVNGGEWHTIRIGENADRSGLVIEFNGHPVNIVSANIQFPLAGSGDLLFGGIGWSGCIRHVRWNYDHDDGDEFIPFYDGTFEHFGRITFDPLAMINRCKPNPCLNGGSCTSYGLSGFKCVCMSGYEGPVCEIAVAVPRSCSEYISQQLGEDIWEEEAWDGVEQRMIKNGATNVNDVLLDLDISGPFKPFRVDCVLKGKDDDDDADGGEMMMLMVHSLLRHSSDRDTVSVRGFPAYGSYRHDVRYDAPTEVVDYFIRSSEHCSQEILFGCSGGVKLMSDGPRSWWIGRSGLQSYAWGGAERDSFMCSCAIDNSCTSDGVCNCDNSGSNDDGVDSGEITEMDHLPVYSLLIGDTGKVGNDGQLMGGGKEARVELGPLSCRSPKSDDIVTFTRRGSTLDIISSSSSTAAKTTSKDVEGLPLIEIKLDFRARHSHGDLIHSKAASQQRQSSTADNHQRSSSHEDWIHIYYTNGNKLMVNLLSAGRILTIEWTSSVNRSAILNDDRWHTVHFLLTPLTASLIVDGNASDSQQQSSSFVWPTIENSWKLGGSGLEGSGGFTGMMRRVTINGENVNIKSLARGHVKPGIRQKCGAEKRIHQRKQEETNQKKNRKMEIVSEPANSNNAAAAAESSLCLHGSECVEFYDSFTCDCTRTAYAGANCADQVSVAFPYGSDGNSPGSSGGGSWLEFKHRRSEASGHGRITIGFQFDGNTKKSAVIDKAEINLLSAASAYTDAKMNLSLTANGAIIVDIMDKNSKSFRLTESRHDYADGNFHMLYLEPKDGHLMFQVDKQKWIQLSEAGVNLADDTSLWIIGDSEFSGCLSAVRIGDTFPLKLFTLSSSLSPSTASFSSSSNSSRSANKMGHRVTAHNLDGIIIDDNNQNVIPPTSAHCPAVPHKGLWTEAKFGPAAAASAAAVGGMRSETVGNGHDDSGRRNEGGLRKTIVPIRRRDWTPILIGVALVLLLTVILMACCCLCCWLQKKDSGNYKTHEGEQHSLYMSPDSSMDSQNPLMLPPSKKEIYI